MTFTSDGYRSHSSADGLSVTDILAIRAELAYPIGERIYLKDYSVSDEILTVYPSVKRLIETRSPKDRLYVIDRLLFGRVGPFIPLHVFRELVRLGRNEITEDELIDKLGFLL
jgi:hypothetical protein